MTQCASHTAAVSLVRECDVLHGVRANVGSDVSLEDVCLVSGNLQVNADAVLCETDRLHAMSESGGAGASADVSRHLHGASAGANSWLVRSGAGSSWVRPAVAAGFSRHLHGASSGAPANVDDFSGAGSAGVASCGVRGLRLRKEAHSRSGSGSFVENSSLSSHHVDHLHTRGVCCAHGEHDLHDARTNSCLGSHAARVNSPGLHSACDNSGGHVNSDGCTYNSCGGVRGGTKPKSTSTREQVGCPAVEKLASLQQAPGRLHVETWAGTRCEPQPADFPGGGGNPAGVCGYGDLPSPLLSSLPCHLGRVQRLGMGWVGHFWRKQPGLGYGCSGVPCRVISAFFCFFCICWLGKERIVPHGVGAPPSFLVFLFILVWMRHGYRATNWKAVLATA